MRALAVLLGLGLTVLTLLLVEGGFRLLTSTPLDLPPWLDRRSPGADAGQAAYHAGRTQVHQSDRHLYWKNRPGIDVRWRGVRVTTNELGLRDEEVGPKRDDEYRILVVGESTAFGDLVERDETFVQVLESELGQRSRRCFVSVINAAVTGYSLFQSAKYLERAGMELAPDLVMVYHGYNDFLPTTFTSERTASPRSGRGLSDREIFEERSRFPANVDLLLYYHSVAYRSLRRTRLPFRERAEPASYEVSDKPRVPQNERDELLEGIRRTTEAKGAELLVLVPAYRSFSEHREALLRFGERTGVPVVDLEPAVESLATSRAELFFPDELHPRPALHRAFAESIVRFLSSERSPRGLRECLGDVRSESGAVDD